MPTLQKQVSRKTKDKKYVKYVVILPIEEVKKAGFKEGQNLKIETREGKVTLEKLD